MVILLFLVFFVMQNVSFAKIIWTSMPHRFSVVFFFAFSRKQISLH